MRKLFVPPVHVAAYAALLIGLVSFGLAVAALSVALVVLVGVNHHAL